MKFKKFLNEKWNTDYKTPDDKKGMWNNWSLEDLQKERDRLKNKTSRTSAESTRLKQVNFAIRAKTGWGKIK